MLAGQGLAFLVLLTTALIFFGGSRAAPGNTVNLEEIYTNPLSNGFGEDIEWVKWDDAVETALEVNKPIFLLIHKTWCHACKSLKKSMQQSNARKAFKKLSQYFVMVNTADDDEPFEEEYRPDGKYIPRLLFLDKNGDVLSQIKNKKAEYKNYNYYYSSPADILNSMKDVLKYFEIEVPEIKKGDSLKPKKPPAKVSGDSPKGPQTKSKPEEVNETPQKDTPKKSEETKKDTSSKTESAKKGTKEKEKKDSKKSEL